MDELAARLAQLCRGRLVLAMQSWLWRLQAWLHAPSWDSKLEGPVSLPVQEEALRGLRNSLHMNDEDLLRASNHIAVVRASYLAPRKPQQPCMPCSLGHRVILR